jgi:hypothetical protein
MHSLKYVMIQNKMQGSYAINPYPANVENMVSS